MNVTDRAKLWTNLIAQAQRDVRVQAVIDYGSSAREEADEWSDLDAILIIRHADFDAFERDWHAWVGRCGALLHAYSAGRNHRAIFDAQPAPLRLDFGLFPDDDLRQRIAGWTLHATGVERAVLLDRTPDQLVTRLVGEAVTRVAPALDLRAESAHVIGDFWYYALRIHALVQRGEWWAARAEYHWYVFDGLAAMLRLIHRAPGRWRLSHAARGISNVASDAELIDLGTAVPGRGEREFIEAFERALSLGRPLSARLADLAGVDFNQSTADRIIATTRIQAS